MWLRFHCSNLTFPVSESTFPSFQQARDWYDLKVYPNGTELLNPIKYETHRAAVAKIHKATGVVSSKVTHIGREEAAKLADLMGASFDSISRNGRWNRSAVVQHYIATLSRETLRVLAGFRPDGGDYYIDRDVTVPEALAKEVFPEVDEW